MSINKRICLFAGFDANGKIDDYVIYFIKALSQYADVYYYGDFDAPQKELAKLKPYCRAAYAKRHGKYDFGSWQELIKLIGRSKISSYDELIITNDSCYGPLYDLGDLFQEMEPKPYDFWGLTAAHFHHIHIQSYFMAFKKPVLDSDIFYDFFAAVKPERSFNDVCLKYETNLTYKLAQQGFSFSTYVPYDDLKDSPYFDTERAIANAHFPLLKVKFFLGGIRDQGPVDDWRKMLSSTNYPIKLIENNLVSRGLSLSELDYNVSHKEKDTSLGNFSIKHKLKEAAKFLLSPLLKIIDKAVLRQTAILNAQFSSLSRRIRELSGGITTLEATLHSAGEVSSPKLSKLDTFSSTMSSPSLIENDDARILAVGNFSDFNLSAFGLDTHTLVSVNNEWIDSTDSNFSVKNLCDFHFTDKNKNKILFDFIIAQPLVPEATKEEVTQFIQNLKSQLLYESVLILSVPSREVKNYEDILSENNLVSTKTSHGLTVDVNPYPAYYDKIDTRKGYKVLIYKLKS